MTNVLELRNIVKTFPGVKALDGMKLELRKGELLAVCGENGAGKSTLMKIVTGVYKPDSGEMLLNGEPIHIKHPSDAYGKGIAIIYQETSLFPELTVLENLFMGHEATKRKFGLSFIDHEKMRQTALDIFGKLGVEIDLDGKVGKFGVATKQMIEIAKALTYDAKILILDEPTASLTSREVTALFDTIKRIKAEGVSMVYISHRLEEIFLIANRVTVIRDGGYVATADTKDVDSKQLVSWMIGRELSDLYSKTAIKPGAEVLSVENLNQGETLRDISFTLRKGEIVGLSGLAGSGRTELAHALCGLSEADSGAIRLEGREIAVGNYHEAIRQGIVYVSEDRKANGLITQMTIRENMTLSILDKLSGWTGIRFKWEGELVEAYTGRLKIKAASSATVLNNLSGGNQQKVSVAKALVAEPRILILDEPTRGVDVGAKSEIHKIIDELVHRDLAILMISSDLPEILGMSDRIYVMKEGRIAGELSREEASQEKILTLAL
ncbi:MAG: sugar ABC transporter ATP-binding protein [Planctomycetota bacterium]|jgi:ABC-type sugar transport system ATPase subunit|nr:sugar ABC transporter ATP-binding protein [Planctomycetota bacterium]